MPVPGATATAPWRDGRKFSRETIRDVHVVLNGLPVSRTTLSSALYAVHITVPIVAMYLFVRYPALRPVVATCLGLVVAGQLYSRVCPIAKLEWSIDPLMENITWKGAELLNCIAPVNKTIKFWYMVTTTAFGLVMLWIVARLFPNGI